MTSKYSAKVIQLDATTRISDQCLEFLNLYVDSGGDQKAAWVEAGFAPGNVGRAMSTIRKYWQEVERIIHKKIGSHVPMALEGIVELALNAKQEATKLKALQDLMARAGYDKPKELIVTEKKAEDMDETELKAELSRLLKADE